MIRLLPNYILDCRAPEAACSADMMFGGTSAWTLLFTAHSYSGSGVANKLAQPKFPSHATGHIQRLRRLPALGAPLFPQRTARSRMSRSRRCSRGRAPSGNTCPLVISRLCCYRSHTSGLKCSTRRPSLIQPSAGQAGTLASRLPTCTASAHLRCPAPLTGHVIGPALTAANQVLTLGNQALVQLAGEQGDALGPGVVPEPVAGHADLAAAAGAQHVLIEIGPGLAVTLRHRRR
jgi:hypothetical protein